MLTNQDATKVIAAVLKKYGSMLPDGLATKVGALNSTKIFRILPENQYRPNFDAYYRSFFAAINVVALAKPIEKAKGGATKRLIGIAQSNDDVYDSFGCPAFCAPAVNPTDRVIYVNRDAPITIGTLYHEFIHFLSHGNFYPEMYAMGGKSPIILEGVTEYLTRAVSPEVKTDRSSQKKYQAWFSYVTSKITGSDDKVMQRMAAMAFTGDLKDVETLGGVVPRL